MSITHMFSQEQQRANAAGYVVWLACERHGVAPDTSAVYARIAREMVAKGHSASMTIAALSKRIRG
jgi:hypothetical protein